MKILPKNVLSRSTGIFFSWEIKNPVLFKLVRGLFLKVTGIDMAEAAQSLEEYPSIQAIFTRKLRPGVRPVGMASVVSPCDGILSQQGAVIGQQLLQAKGITYSVDELLGQPIQGSFEFMTIYLAPHHYHRVHVPASGVLTKIRYIPGQLWPVNALFAQSLPQLFLRNERMVFEIELKAEVKLYLVMVGAYNVGKISTPFLPQVVSNLGMGAQVHTIDCPVEKGEYLATFMLGSTVVLVAPTGLLATTAKCPWQVKMGQNFN